MYLLQSDLMKRYMQKNIKGSAQPNLWYFFGQANVKYLFGKNAVKPYAVLVSLCVLLGSLAQVDLVWNMADCFNSLMVIPNILALFFLSSQMKELHDDYYHNFLKNKKVK